MRAYYSRVPLRTQSQIEQAIKNYLEIPESKKPTQVLLSFGGGTGIYLRIGKKTLSTFIRFGPKATNVYLGNYYSEELDTDPSVYYPYLTYYVFTYEEMLKRGEYARIHGVPPAETTLKAVKETIPLEEPDDRDEPLVLTEVCEAQCSQNTNERRKELEARLRMLDLQIEREKILSELATL